MPKLATPEEASKVVDQVISAYKKNSEDINLILRAFRDSRKYGLPVISVLEDDTEAYNWAIRFVISLTNTWPEDDFLTLVEDDLFMAALKNKRSTGTKLYDDAADLLSLARSNKP